MRTSIFQYPYEKVFRRTKGALSRLGMHVINYDAMRGSITAESNFSLSRPSVKLDLFVEKMEDQHTKVTVRGLQLRKRFFQKPQSIELNEAALLEALSTII